MICVGYARVSTEDQNLSLQLDALAAAGCAVVYQDKTAGPTTSRPGLIEAVARCAAGDLLVVWKLDRLGRSRIDVLVLMDDLRRRGVALRVLTGQGAMVDSMQPDGRMIYGIFAVLAEFERELIGERTKAGMQAARERGQHVGRPRKLTPRQLADARSSLNTKADTRAAIAARLGVDVATLRRALRGSMAGSDIPRDDDQSACGAIPLRVARI